MGVYARKDSCYWWMCIERPGQRPLLLSTGIVRDGGSPGQDRARRAEAQRVYSVTKAKHVLGTVTVTKPIIGVADYIAWYETNVSLHRRAGSRERSMLKTLRLAFGHLETLAQIDVHLVEEWKTARKKLVKASTVNRELDVLKAMMSKAVPKYLERNPIAGVRRFRLAETEPRVLTPAEEYRLLAIATEEEFAALIMAIDTLLRLSNIVNLKWEQVKMPEAVIVPLNAKVSHDAVPITRRLHVALAKLPRPDEWVFPSFHHGTGTTAPKNNMIRAFNALCQKAVIPYGRAAGGLTFHCLRHTGATRALQKGASVRTVMKLGGWKGERMVMRYTHATDQDVRDAAESIGGQPPLTFKKKRA